MSHEQIYPFYNSILLVYEKERNLVILQQVTYASQQVPLSGRLDCHTTLLKIPFQRIAKSRQGKDYCFRRSSQSATVRSV